MIYTLINPHDPYTFEAPTPRIAALLCMIIGGKAYGAEPRDGDAEKEWPVMLITTEEDVEAEFLKRHGVTISKALEEDWKLMPAAFRSLWITSVAERVGIAAAMEACPTDKARAAFATAYEDEKRSSLTDLATRARALADRFEQNEYQPDEVVA